MTPEHYAAIGSVILAVVGGPPAVRAIGRWIAKRIEQRQRAAEEHERRVDERDDRTEERLWSRVEALERRSDECGEALAEAQSVNLQAVQIVGEVRTEIAECKRDRADQAREIEALRRKVERASADITQRVEIAAEKVATRRSPPPPKPRGDG